MTSVTITLDLPDSRLHAHAKGGWRAKRPAVKSARGLAHMIAIRDRGAFRRPDRATIHYAFFVPDNRQRDEANLIQMCKPYVDGLCDAGLIVGDHWQVLSTGGVSVEIDRDRPRVELTITERDDDA